MVSIFLKTLRRQLKSYPVPTAFLMIGFIISLLIISFGTTSFVQLKQMVESRNENVPPNSISVSVTLGTEDYEFEKIISLFDRLADPNTGLIFTGLSGILDNAPGDQKVSLRAELFQKDLNWKYLLNDGRYYEVDELMSGKLVALIGKNLTKYTTRDRNKDFIKISGVNYEVIGIIGKESENTSWDDTVVLPAFSLPDAMIESLETSGVLGFIMHNETKMPLEDLSFLERAIKTQYRNTQVSAEEIQKEVDVVSMALTNPDFTQVLSVLVYVLALINSINLTSFWFNQRKYEIGIRKAFGHTNVSIIKLLLFEMLVIISVSGIISVLIHFAVSSFVSSFVEFHTQIYVENVVVAAIFVALTTLLTTIIPALKCIKLQPIEALKK